MKVNEARGSRGGYGGTALVGGNRGGGGAIGAVRGDDDAAIVSVAGSSPRGTGRVGRGSVSVRRR